MPQRGGDAGCLYHSVCSSINNNQKLKSKALRVPKSCAKSNSNHKPDIKIKMTDKNNGVKPLLKDSFSRHLNYLRISVTDRCNLQCMYCRRTHPFLKLSHHNILRYEEILRVLNIAVQMGISKVRITGGEPLVRKGIFDFIKQIHKIKGLQEISMTTNGVLLEQYAEKLLKAGIQRINVSLDTLNREKFIHINGFDYWHQVWKGIEKANQLGMYPIKINIVAMRGINDDEIQAFGRLSQETPYIIRFIEYMPIGQSDMYTQYSISSQEIKQQLESIGKLYKIHSSMHDGPAEQFHWVDSPGTIGLIHPMSHHFCQTCNRLRLTADGNLRPCLLSTIQIDLKKALREGGTDQDIMTLVEKAVLHKPHHHGVIDSFPNGFPGQMNAIGG